MNAFIIEYYRPGGKLPDYFAGVMYPPTPFPERAMTYPTRAVANEVARDLRTTTAGKFKVAEVDQ